MISSKILTYKKIIFWKFNFSKNAYTILWLWFYLNVYIIILLEETDPFNFSYFNIDYESMIYENENKNIYKNIYVKCYRLKNIKKR